MSSGGRQKARMRTEPSIASSSRVTDVPARTYLKPIARIRSRLWEFKTAGGVSLAGHFDEEPSQSPRVRSEVKAHPVFGLVEQDFVFALDVVWTFLRFVSNRNPPVIYALELVVKQW